MPNSIPAPVENINPQTKMTYYNVYGGMLIKTTYDPNTNSYHTERSVWNHVPYPGCKN